MSDRPKIIDAFMLNGEFDILELRLDTMGDAVDWFVVVQADVDHQNHSKPYHFDSTHPRWARWADKLVDVRATDLPTTEHDADPWAREWAQREWVWQGLAQVPNLSADDVVLHGDVDEIVHPLYARNVRPKPRQFVAFGQRLHCFAVDWQHPDEWGGTVAVTVETAMACGRRDLSIGHPGAWQIVRNQRNGLISGNFPDPQHWRWQGMADAGWHFSWLGGKAATLAKVGSFCHPEIADRTLAGLEADRFLREGFHVDGRRMIPVEVDDTWPAYIYERRCPESWWRPR